MQSTRMIHRPAVRRAFRPILLSLFALTLSPAQSVLAEKGGRITLPPSGPIPHMRGEVKRQEMSVVVPIPSPRPTDKGKEMDKEKEKAGTKKDQPAPQRKDQPRPQSTPKEETACRKALSELGVTFEDREPIGDKDIGCSIPHPLVIKDLSRKISLQPEATLNCTTALALARFFAGQVPALARKHLKQPIRSVRHASAYVCRARNGTNTLSEHAFGNALDIAAFTLADGATLTVSKKDDLKSDGARFLYAFRKAACGPFLTVLGPGSDADHADHFHLDMKSRRNDRPYCR